MTSIDITILRIQKGKKSYQVANYVFEMILPFTISDHSGIMKTPYSTQKPISRLQKLKNLTWGPIENPNLNRQTFPKLQDFATLG